MLIITLFFIVYSIVCWAFLLLLSLYFVYYIEKRDQWCASFSIRATRMTTIHNSFKVTIHHWNKLELVFIDLTLKTCFFWYISVSLRQIIGNVKRGLARVDSPSEPYLLLSAAITLSINTIDSFFLFLCPFLSIVSIT
jgi:hypothetical protein